MDASLVWTILKEPRTSVAAASLVGSAPLVWGGLVWVATLSFFNQILVGIVVGIATMASFHFMAVHRSQSRMRKAVIVQQLSRMDGSALKRIFPSSAVPSWIQQTADLEKVSWINRELEEIWQPLDEAASEMIKAQLQPILDEYKFGPVQKLEVKSITLGKVAPLIGGIKFTPVGENEAMIELEVDWRHGRDMKFVLDVKSTGPDFRVQVKDVVFQGVFRVILKPLTDQIPCFGAAVVSLREPPVIDFATKFLGGDVLKLPGIDGMIDDIIKTAVTDMLVWPSRIVVPILPGDYSFLELRPVAYVEVHVVEARHLLNKEIIGKSDPFCYVYVRQKKEVMQRTATKSNTTNPKWNEHFVVDVEDPDSQSLQFKVMDSDKVDSADFLGMAHIPIRELEPNVAKDIWLKLIKDPKNPAGDKNRGELHVVVTFKPYKKQDKDKPQELLPSVPEGAGIAKPADVKTNKDISTPAPAERRTEEVVNTQDVTQAEVPPEVATTENDNSNLAAENGTSKSPSSAAPAAAEPGVPEKESSPETMAKSSEDNTAVQA